MLKRDVEETDYLTNNDVDDGLVIFTKENERRLRQLTNLETQITDTDDWWKNEFNLTSWDEKDNEKHYLTQLKAYHDTEETYKNAETDQNICSNEGEIKDNVTQVGKEMKKLALYKNIDDETMVTDTEGNIQLDPAFAQNLRLEGEKMADYNALKQV